MQLEYFKLIDRIIAIDVAARTIETRSTVPDESPVFEGHFPTHPLVPGVMLLETMAQASGWLLIGLTGFTRMPFFASVSEAKFRAFVTPGMVLDVNSAVEHEGSGYAVARAAIKSDGKPVCNSTLSFRLNPFPTQGFREAMEKVAGEIAFPMELKVKADA